MPTGYTIKYEFLPLSGDKIIVDFKIEKVEYVQEWEDFGDRSMTTFYRLDTGEEIETIFSFKDKAEDRATETLDYYKRKFSVKSKHLHEELKRIELRICGSPTT